MSAVFEQGRVYDRRRDIHAKLGGQQQGGIATPANQPFVILFTGEAGEAHGYNDGWTADGVFRYFGEGQKSDMEWARGNRAIRDHATEGKDLLLFEMLGKGKGVRFRGQFTCADYEELLAPDTDGVMRKAFIFDLVPLSDFGAATTERKDQEGVSLQQLRQRAYQAASVGLQQGPDQAKRNVYRRSGDVRDYILARAGNHCEGCEAKAPFLTTEGRPYLEPHHIRRVSDGGPDHPAHVIALCPNCHRRVHFGQDGKAYNAELADRVREVERRFR